MAERAKYRWSLSNLFKSNVLSSTNPRDDISQFLNKPISTGATGDLIDSISLVNLNKIINDLRNPLATHQDKYLEYKNMETEVIVAAALRSYADDATVFDNTKGTPIWVETEDPLLGNELTNFLDSIQVSYKLWGWAYNVAQYGDLYLENIYNKRGFVTGIKPVSSPENILHLVDHEDDSEGYVVKRDDRKVANQSRASSEFDAYAVNKFTHFYLDDTPRINSVIVQAVGEGGAVSPLELNILRGRSILEPIRVNYRILRLLEDTVITNKIARSEYIRVFNVEVGEATGEGSTRIINKLKRIFDAKPRFDGNTGEYQSQRIYRPAADAIFNSVNKGVGAIDIKEVGGNVETQFMVDIDYFKSKMFTGLQIPKSFLGFEESLPTNPGTETLAKLDIRYTRAVRRVQLAVIRGIEDLLDAYLVSRGRPHDTKKYEIKMTNPSSAEELSRIKEVAERVDVIDKILQTIQNYTNETVNISQLYAELVDEYLDSPRIKEVFNDLLSKSISINHLNINSKLNEARMENISSGKNLYSSVLDLKVNGMLSETPMEGTELSPEEEQMFGGASFGGGGGTSFGSPSLTPLEPGDLGEPEPIEGETELPEGEEGLPSEEEEYTPGETGVPLGSLSAEAVPGEPVEAVGLKLINGKDYYSVNSNRIRLIEDLEKLSIHGPSHMRTSAEALTYKLVVEGFTDDNVKECDTLFKKINEYYNESGISDIKYKTISETLLSKDKQRKRKLFESILKEED